MQVKNNNAAVEKSQESCCKIAFKEKSTKAGANNVDRNVLRHQLIKMEMHSYAKRRISKKWGIEHKRKLVEARITYESLFANKPTNSMVPWKKILTVAKLDDFNVFFVRKQWSTMVAKYKQYKHCRLSNIPTKAINDEMVEKITKEWEFFHSIHNFMTRKTNNLHSYALTMETDSLPEQRKQTAAIAEELYQAIKEEDCMNTSDNWTNTCESNQNGDNSVKICDIESAQQMQNTDHDFYTKKEAAEQSRLFSHAHTIPTFPPLFLRDTVSNASTVLRGNNSVNDVNQRDQGKTTDRAEGRSQLFANKETLEKLSERDKYYRHRRHFNNRLERRFDALLNVFGQIVKAEYPSIDVNPLINGATSVGSSLVTHLFSSDEDDSYKEEFTTSAEKKNNEIKNGRDFDTIANSKHQTQNGSCNGPTSQ